MSKSLLAAVLLPLVACSANHAKPEAAADHASTTEQGSQLYEPDDTSNTTTAATSGASSGAMSGSTDHSGTMGATTDSMGGDHAYDTAGASDATAQAEQTFAKQVIAHHEEGIQMAKLAQQRAEHAELKDLAAKMVSKEEAQVAQLEALQGGSSSSMNHDLGYDDGANDVNDDLGATSSASDRDVAATNDGVTPSRDGLNTPTTGADKTAQDDASLANDDASAAPEHGMGSNPGSTGSQGSQDHGATASTGPSGSLNDGMTASDEATGATTSPGVTTAQDDDTNAGQTGAMPSDDEDVRSTASNDVQGADVSHDLDALASAEDFDKAFLDAMIQHHEEGVAMIRAVSPRLEDGQAKQLADQIVAEQSEEIAKMKGWRSAWFEADTVTSM